MKLLAENVFLLSQLQIYPKKSRKFLKGHFRNLGDFFKSKFDSTVRTYLTVFVLLKFFNAYTFKLQYFYASYENFNNFCTCSSFI